MILTDLTGSESMANHSSYHNEERDEINTVTTKLSDAVQADFEKLHDVTSNADELNVLDGIPATLTATELGYVDGVTSAIQTQLNTKAPSVSPVLTTPQINDTSSDHQYVVAVSELAADRTVTLPLLTGNDEFVFKSYHGIDTGWLPVTDSWTYASATTINVPSGAASLYRKGDKIKLTQTTAKYFYVVAVAHTLLTVTGGSDYSVANAAITLPYYSHASSPVGFPAAFNTGTVTWDTGTIDNGTGGQQPTAGKSWFTISGNRVSHYLELGGTNVVKNTAAPNINFTIPATIPAMDTTYKGQFSMLGFGRFAGTVYKMAWVAPEASTTVVQLRTADNANVADNAAIQSTSFEYSYLF